MLVGSLKLMGISDELRAELSFLNFDESVFWAGFTDELASFRSQFFSW
jgi:hypothetical protein